MIDANIHTLTNTNEGIHNMKRHKITTEAKVRDVMFNIHETISDMGTIDNDEDKGFVEGLVWVFNMLEELDKESK